MINQNNFHLNDKNKKISVFGGKKIWWWVFAIIILLVLFVLWLFNQEADNSVPTLNNSKLSKVDETLLYGQGKNYPSQGEASAKARIVEFGDFECPYCGQSFPVVREILQKYQGKIYFVFRNFPLTEDHPHALRAAEASACANDQGKFWPMHDKLFINQNALEDDNLKIYAKSVGLNSNQFNSCLQTHKYLASINEDIDQGLLLGVKATPTFFINGYKIEGSIPKDIFIQLIEKALQE